MPRDDKGSTNPPSADDYLDAAREVRDELVAHWTGFAAGVQRTMRIGADALDAGLAAAMQVISEADQPPIQRFQIEPYGRSGAARVHVVFEVPLGEAEQGELRHVFTSIPLARRSELEILPKSVTFPTSADPDNHASLCAYVAQLISNTIAGATRVEWGTDFDPYAA